jgi:Tfp pilus assembly protein FimT
MLIIPSDSILEMKAPLSPKQSGDAGGFSVIELLIVATMITVLTGFAFIQITQARQALSRTNAAREFTSYLEKARLDSVRRHPDTTAEMAQVAIINSTFYSVTLDTDADGSMDAPRVIGLPADSNLSFNGPFPRTIMFNWRGRTVDSSGNVTTPLSVTISNNLTSRIDITNAGQPALDTTITSDPVSNSSPAPSPSFRSKTQIP